MEAKTFDFEDWRFRFEAGDDSAPSELVEHFYGRLVMLAQRRLKVMPPQVADQEGAVISALRSFFSGVEGGQFSGVGDEHDLWRLLATITARKAIRQMRQHWKKAGEANNVDRKQDVGILFSPGVTPEQEAILMEECQRCLEALGDPQLKRIALLRMEGLETSEIADELSIHLRSVQRKLKLIEKKWMTIFAN